MIRSLATSKGPKKRGRWWITFALIFGIPLLGGVLTRLGPPLLALGVLAAVAVGVITLIRGRFPLLGLRSRKLGFAALGAAFLLSIGGAAGAASDISSEPPAAFFEGEREPHGASLEADGKPSPSPTPTPVPTTFDEVHVDTEIPFERATVDDPSVPEGTTAVTTAGVAGTLRTTHVVTYVDGAEVSREKVRESVTVAPVTEVTTRGTLKPPPAPKPVPLVQTGGNGCDPNYADACVPIASDVDCAGGSGNGPAYLSGSARVVGTDIYDLDRDKNGIACD